MKLLLTIPIFLILFAGGCNDSSSPKPEKISLDSLSLDSLTDNSKARKPILNLVCVIKDDQNGFNFSSFEVEIDFEHKIVDGLLGKIKHEGFLEIDNYHWMRLYVVKETDNTIEIRQEPKTVTALIGEDEKVQMRYVLNRNNGSLRGDYWYSSKKRGWHNRSDGTNMPINADCSKVNSDKLF